MLKRILFGFFGLVTSGIIYLSIVGSNVQEIKTEIEISASPEKVWEIITNIESWEEWSPIINKSVGTATLGSKLEITMMGKEKGKDGPKYSPEIIQLDEGKIFRWRAHMMAGFVFTNDKVFELEKTSTGTKFVHKELFSGLLAPLFCGQMEKHVPPMLDMMNQALKELAERT